MDIPIGQYAYQRADGLLPSVRLENVFFEKTPTNLKTQGVLMTRPALTRFAQAGSGPNRGLFWQDGKFGNQALAVSGTGLYLIGKSGTANMIGGVPGIGYVEIAASPTTALIANGGALLQTDGLTVTAKAFPDNLNVRSVGFIDGYFLAVPVDSSRIYYTDLVTGEFDATRFISAERYPDDLVKLIVTSDEVWGMGTDSVEVFVPTGIDTSEQPPFQRVDGRLYKKGVLAAATAVEVDNTVYWVGQSKDSGPTAYRGDTVPLTASDPSIAERIQRADPNAMSAWAFGIFGHSFYVLGLGSEGTWALDIATGDWFNWTSLGRGQWRAWMGTGAWGGMAIAGDISDGTIWLLDPLGVTDGGTPIRQRVTAGASVTGKQRCDNISLDCAVGQVAEGGSASINLKFSDDQGRTWQDEGPCSLGVHGDYLARVRWDRLGEMRPPVRIFEWETTSPVRMRVNGARINESF